MDSERIFWRYRLMKWVGVEAHDHIWFFWGYDCVFIFTFKEAGIALQSVSKLTFVITSVKENAEQVYWDFEH